MKNEISCLNGSVVVLIIWYFRKLKHRSRTVRTSRDKNMQLALLLMLIVSRKLIMLNQLMITLVKGYSRRCEPTILANSTNLITLEVRINYTI